MVNSYSKFVSDCFSYYSAWKTQGIRMNEIKFIKILKYDLRSKEENFDFDWMRNVTLQTVDPESLYLGQLKEIQNAQIVFHSTLRRAVECLPDLPTVDKIPIDALREIKFDLGEFCTKEEFSERGSVIVRQQFKKFFVQDSLIVSREQMLQEVREVLKKCTESQFSRVAVVSHSFRLSIIEAFIKTKAEIETTPNLIHRFIFDDKKRFDFGEGFTVDKSQVLEIIG